MNMNLLQKIIFGIAFLFPVLFFGQNDEEIYPPKEFQYVHKAIPDVAYDIRYAGNHNFIGEPIEGYVNPVALLTSEAAAALKKVQEELKTRGYQLKVFDAYRPQQAVNHFIKWAKDTAATRMKTEFYPEVDKKNLFKLDYIASRSGHTRGSTVDLTVIETVSGKELDMGSPYDFFGEISHHGAPGITPEQERNRSLLKNAMEKHGFRPLATEWWHYTLKNEPYPDTYFDFPVK